MIDGTDPFRVTLEAATAMALPAATHTKIYATFKLLGFNYPNKNKDGFLAEDVSAEVVRALVGSPIYVAEDLRSHPRSDAGGRERAAYQVGTVVKAEKRLDGLYCLAALKRDYLTAMQINPGDLAAGYSVSVETVFDRLRAKYRVGTQTYPYLEARDMGIAGPLGMPDDRTRYDARFLVPAEFHAVALLHRGTNADPQANVLRTAAARDREVNEEVGEIS